MALQDILRDLRLGITHPQLQIGTPLRFEAQPRKPFTAIIRLRQADTLNIRILLTEYDMVNYTLSFYQRQGNKLIGFGQAVSYEHNTLITKEIPADVDVFLHIDPKTAIKGNITATPQGYTPSSRMEALTGFGYYTSAALQTRKRPIECHETLVYELVDGKLPDGLTLISSGVIMGEVGNLDCSEHNTDLPPSWNWYSDNHDDTAQAWGRVWKFKVRLYLLNQPETYTEKWFCIRVYNNWSLDRDRFKAAPDIVVEEAVDNPVKPYQLPKLNSLCPPCPSPTEFVPKRIDTRGLCGVTKAPESAMMIDGVAVPFSEIRFSKLGKCPSCLDPTRPKDIEEYSIPSGTIIRTPDELLQHYARNRNNFDQLVMHLHSSKILPDIYKNLKQDKPNRSTAFEIKITPSKVTLIRYHSLPGRSFDDVDEQILSIRNTANQDLPNTAYSYSGYTVWSILTW